MASAPTITLDGYSLREIAEARVREEYEPIIQAEVDRRQAAVEAALAGEIDRPATPPAPEPPKPRRPRSDKGTHRPRPVVPMLPTDPPAQIRDTDQVHAITADDGASDKPTDTNTHASDPADPAGDVTGEAMGEARGTEGPADDPEGAADPSGEAPAEPMPTDKAASPRKQRATPADIARAAGARRAEREAARQDAESAATACAIGSCTCQRFVHDPASGPLTPSTPCHRNGCGHAHATHAGKAGKGMVGLGAHAPASDSFPAEASDSGPDELLGF